MRTMTMTDRELWVGEEWSRGVDATTSDDVDALMEIMARTPEIKTFKGTRPGDWADEKRSIFHEAAMKDSARCVELCAREGLNIHDVWSIKSGRDVYHHTPLTLVIMCENFQEREQMLGSILNAPSSELEGSERGWELAMLAGALQSDASIMRTIHAHLGPEWSARWSLAISEQGDNLLHLAAQDGCQEVLDLLLEWPGMKSCATMSSAARKTPLEIALAHGQSEFASKLAAWLAAAEEAVEIAAAVSTPAKAGLGPKSRL